jgi:hypothetical protein
MLGLRRLMRLVQADPIAAKRKAERAQREVLTEYNLEAVALKVMTRLGLIADQMADADG